MWIAWGGGSNGYAAVWTSSDGRQWQQVLDAKPTDNRATGVGSVNVTFDAGNGHLAAYASNVTWSAADGTTWGQAALIGASTLFLWGTIEPGRQFGPENESHRLDSRHLSSGVPTGSRRGS